MAHIADKHSAAVIAALGSLRPFWENVTDDSELERIKGSITKTLLEAANETLHDLLGELEKKRK